jgi:hypothetical protein
MLMPDFPPGPLISAGQMLGVPPAGPWCPATTTA